MSSNIGLPVGEPLRVIIWHSETLESMGPHFEWSRANGDPAAGYRGTLYELDGSGRGQKKKTPYEFRIEILDDRKLLEHPDHSKMLVQLIVAGELRKLDPRPADE